MNKIVDILREIPKDAGVYQYFDENGRLLYIGKAKNLSNRVKSYWFLTPKIRPKFSPTTRIGKMLSLAKYIDYIVVDSEEDALILENSLIKQLKPKYNILLRDDKTYPYIVIDEKEDFPRFEITRKVIKLPKVKYYGPFPTGSKALLDAIYDFFPLVQKKSCLKGKKACLFYEIGKCLAPCEGKITKSEYAKIVKEAKYAINNRKILIDKMSERMLKLASSERFEEAAKLRDSIEAIKALQMKSTIDIATSANYDIFAIDNTKDKGVVVKIFMREGRIVSSTHSIFRNLEAFDRDEAYKQAIISHYKNLATLDLNKILVAHEFADRDITNEVISKMVAKKIKIEHPKSGNRSKLVDLAIKNAKEILKQEHTQTTQIEEKLKELLSLSVAPYRVECFDNSHMMGQATVGAMIVYDSGEFDKSSYRRYELEAKDEYAQMKETLTRRVNSFKKSSPPDLWVIDGGATLLKLAIEILDNVGVNLDVVAIAKEKLDSKAHRAKGAAKDIIYTQNGEIIELKSSDSRLHFLQRLRDEAHRFAISYHKQKKRKEDMNLALFEHVGVGKEIVKKLLNYFGNFEDIEKASYEEIAKITNKKVAESIKGKKYVKN
jgi:excinuclease ABC subunit C